MNAINQMCDETGIMELRSKEFKLRLLNREIIGQKDRLLAWKLINSLAPLLLVVLLGILFQIVRKRKYAH